MLDRVERAFPRLVETGYVKTSEASASYNCVAFSLGDETRYWWPPIDGSRSDTYWPTESDAGQETLESFLRMYQAYGFIPCDGLEREPGFVRIAIFIGPPDDCPEHVAVQVASGKWISKMWSEEAIAHTVEALEGGPHWYRVGAVIRCEAGSIPDGLRRILDRYGGP